MKNIEQWLIKELDLEITDDFSIKEAIKIIDPKVWMNLMKEYSEYMCEIQRILCKYPRNVNACKTLLRLFNLEDLRRPEGKYHIGGAVLVSKEQFIKHEHDLSRTVEEVERRLHANYLPNMIKEQHYYE